MVKSKKIRAIIEERTDEKTREVEFSCSLDAHLAYYLIQYGMGNREIESISINGNNMKTVTHKVERMIKLVEPEPMYI